MEVEGQSVLAAGGPKNRGREAEEMTTVSHCCSVAQWRDAAQQSCGGPKPSNCQMRAIAFVEVRQSGRRDGAEGLSACSSSRRDQISDVGRRTIGGESKGLGFMLPVSCSLNEASSSNFEEAVDAAAGDVISRGGVQLVSGSDSNLGSSGVYGAEAEREDGVGGGSDNGNGRFGGGGGGGGEGAGDGGEDRSPDEEFGPVLNAEQVQQEVQGRGVTLPSDMLEAAKTVGIRQLLLSRYIELQVGCLSLPVCVLSSFSCRSVALDR